MRGRPWHHPRRIKDTDEFVSHRIRAWVDCGLDQASQDPYAMWAVGDLHMHANAAAALMNLARAAIDAVATPTVETFATAQIAIAEARDMTTEIAILATNKLYEPDNLDRHWRNAHTHTLHHSVHWIYAIIDNRYLNGVKPPLHAWS